MNFGSILLLLSLETLVLVMAVPALNLHSEIGNVLKQQAETTTGPIKHSYLDHSLKEYLQSGYLEQKNKVILKNLENPNPSKDEQFHEETNFIRSLAQANSTPDASVQSDSSVLACGQALMEMTKSILHELKIRPGGLGEWAGKLGFLYYCVLQILWRRRLLVL
ncbi:uncharacterized protein MELLADRAFT_66784 [Melampsora larici-populina 98AG31]|uniref:Secreted protein n=1 Tax=Melampsora larici-populina (strain 98AG31 / pathotype 3-4-7) TaxID=747676 RepID=F4S0K0_MELLP|nr:uncharacterized protein MELLADRAFT_66784 [Melampsora larici-populina 98AG31]EGG01779.1 secreted protein [Melampsora larici-populina 98AG31]